MMLYQSCSLDFVCLMNSLHFPFKWMKSVLSLGSRWAGALNRRMVWYSCCADVSPGALSSFGILTDWCICHFTMLYPKFWWAAGLILQLRFSLSHWSDDPPVPVFFVLFFRIYLFCILYFVLFCSSIRICALLAYLYFPEIGILWVLFWAQQSLKSIELWVALYCPYVEALQKKNTTHFFIDAQPTQRNPSLLNFTLCSIFLVLQNALIWSDIFNVKFLPWS